MRKKNTNHPSVPDLCNPDWLPTDQEELDVLDDAARRVAWEKAMATQGIKVLTLGLTPEEEQARIDAWARANFAVETVLSSSGAALMRCGR